MISRVRSRSGKGTATNCITDMGDTTVGAFATADADPFAASVSIRAWIVHWASLRTGSVPLPTRGASNSSNRQNRVEASV